MKEIGKHFSLLDILIRLLTITTTESVFWGSGTELISWSWILQWWVIWTLRLYLNFHMVIRWQPNNKDCIDNLQIIQYFLKISKLTAVPCKPPYIVKEFKIQQCSMSSSLCLRKIKHITWRVAYYYIFRYPNTKIYVLILTQFV